MFTKIIPDTGGVQDELEKKIESTEGVDNFEVIKVKIPFFFSAAIVG